MKTARYGSMIVMLAVFGALVLAAPAAATGPPLEGSGTGEITGLDIAPIRDVGGNDHQHRTVVGTVEGALEGEFVQETAGTVHTNHPDNLVTFRGVLTFTGTIEGCGDEEHTLVLRMSGKGTVPEPGFPVTEARLRAIGHPDTTVDITGQGTVSQTGPLLEYELDYICR